MTLKEATRAPLDQQGPPTSSSSSAPAQAGSSPGSARGGSTVRRSRRLPKKRTVDPVMDPFSTSGRTRESKMLKLALAKSIVETKFVEATALPSACVFYPTVDEFSDPIQYIASIQKQAERTGICKIVPPKGWKPAFAIDLDDESVQFETRLQRIHKLQEGLSYGDGRVHTFKSYRAYADTFRKMWFRARNLDPDKMTSAEIEQEYWRIIETGVPNVEVEYANDLDTTIVGSGFYRSYEPTFDGKETVDFDDPEYYRNTAWNVNNLPDAYGSLLRHVHTMIKGINIPWLYCGMMFASFCWHTEDNYMYSVNYQHIGARKRWYGIPLSHGDHFEAVVKKRVPERFREDPDLLFHLTTMVPPSALKAEGVEVFTLVQEPGDIIVTFPKGYHAGFSEGFNCNEAVNFVLPNWIQYSRECIERYRLHARPSIFSHDHFIFHFGSTQSLEEYTAEDCEMLLKELRLMFHEEQNYKKEFHAAGLQSVLELSADVMLDDQSMAMDDIRQCFHCKHNVFFSGVTCSCMPTRISCLRHTKLMCACPMEKRTLIQWVSSGELRYAIRRVQEKIRSLKALAMNNMNSSNNHLVLESVNYTITPVKMESIQFSSPIKPIIRMQEENQMQEIATNSCGNEEIIDLT